MESTSISPEESQMPEHQPLHPILYIIPTVMSSHLELNGERIWLDPKTLAEGKLEKLNKDSLLAESLFDSVYGQLISYLQSGHEVIPFPYDWCNSLSVAANRLANELQEVLAASSRPLRILAHGSGALLIAIIKQQHKTLWEQLAQRNSGALLIIDTSFSGFEAVRGLLSGMDQRMEHILEIDPNHSKRQLLDIFASLQGLLELLPAHALDLDYWPKQAMESKTDLSIPSEVMLENARKVQSQWNDTSFEDDFVSIINSSPLGEGIVSPNQVYYAHPDKILRPELFPAVRDILETGISDHKSLSREALDVSTIERKLYFSPQTQLIPDELYHLYASSLGFKPEAPLVYEGDPISVSVTFGNLRESLYPVAVGHHIGDGLVSAERTLDYYLDNRLNAFHKLGVYPGELETAEIILQLEKTPPGGVVIGLGAFGELTAGGLNRSFTHAVLKLALAKLQMEMLGIETNQSLGISSILIGTGFGGLNMQSSIRAVLQAILQANVRIIEHRVSGLKPLTRLEFIEVEEDRSIQAIRLLDEILEEEQFSPFILEPRSLRHASGGQRPVIRNRETNWWHRVKVEAIQLPPQNPYRSRKPEKGPLKFTSLTDKARAEVSNLAIQRVAVDQLIDQAVQKPNWDPHLTKTMFELLFPNEFKDYAMDRRNLIWIVDEESASYPWELLYDPSMGEIEPISVKAGMLRQLEVSSYRQQVKTLTNRTVLTVGDPKSEFVPLPAAREEAKQVHEILKTNGYKGVNLLEAQSSDIIKALFAQPYQIMHLCGHGVYDPEAKKYQTGMVLGKGVFLTPDMITQLRYVPELVFLNCCHLGATEEDEITLKDRNRIAANLGTQLIRMGVKAVIAAGWAIADEAARTFAVTFYEKMLDGANFGHAVHQARQDTFHKHPNTHTWGAYQCYGDPYYQLREGGEKEVQEQVYFDPKEALIDLENIGIRTDDASVRDKQVLLKELEEVEQRIKEHPEWLENSKILVALFHTAAKLDEYEKAIALGDLLKKLEWANFSLRSLEQLANLKVHYAIRLKTLLPKSATSPLNFIDEAISELETYLKLGKTSERHSLLGSAYKRKAIASLSRTSFLQALDNSYRHYKEAFDMSEKQDFYPLFNMLVMKVLRDLYGIGNESNEEIQAYLDSLYIREKQVSGNKAKKSNFWERVISTHIDEYRLLAAKVENEERILDKIVKDYTDAWKFNGSYRKRNSVLAQHEFYCQALRIYEGYDEEAKRIEELRQKLISLKGRLEKGMED